MPYLEIREHPIGLITFSCPLKETYVIDGRIKGVFGRLTISEFGENILFRTSDGRLRILDGGPVTIQEKKSSAKILLTRTSK